MLGTMLARLLTTATAATLAAGAAIALAGACHHAGKTKPLAAAGSTGDDGSGILAKASIKFLTSEDEGGFEPEAQKSGGYYDQYGGYYNSFTYGGFGGDGYGGSYLYAGYQPYMQYQTPNRTPEYAVVYSSTDAGGIEGSVTWPKPPSHPASIAGPGSCGTLDNDSLRLGSGNTVVGAVVYLEKVTSGRAVPWGSKPLFVGGTLEQRGCQLTPRVQVAGPLPAQLVISNDDELRTALAVSKVGDGGSRVEHTLEPGGSETMGVQTAGVMKVEDTAQGLAPAWIVAANHPYFTLTDDHGRFRLDDVVAGDYTLVVWQAPVVTGVTNGVVQYGEPIVVKKKVTVKKVTATKLKIELP